MQIKQTQKKLSSLSILSLLIISIIFIKMICQESLSFTLQYLNINDPHEINSLLDFFSNKDIQADTNLTPEIIQTKYIQHNQGWIANNHPERAYQIIIAKIKNQIVGVTIAYIYDNGKCYFQTIIVDKKFRRQKIASQMLQKLEKDSKIQEIRFSTTTDNISACKFIESQEAIIDKFVYLIKLIDHKLHYDSHFSYVVHQLNSRNKEDIEKISILLNNQEIKDKVNSSNYDYKIDLDTNQLQALYILDEKGQVCGVLCYFCTNNICKTSGLAVAKNYRNKGIAKNLILSLHQKALEQSCVAIETRILLDNIPAINCYRSLGFINKNPQPFNAKKIISHESFKAS